MDDDLQNAAKAAISNLAQQSVDIAIAQSRASGTDPIDAIQGLIAFNTEALHWAREALRALRNKTAAGT